MADAFESHAVFSSEFSNIKADSFSFTEKPISVKMKDEISISENSEKLNVGISETQEIELKDNTHVPKVTDFVSQSLDESIKGKSSNFEENLVGYKDDGSVRCSTEIEVIDDTTMVDISQVGKSCSFDGKSGRNRKKKNANHQLEKDNGEKMMAREEKGKNMEEAKEINVPVSNGCKRKEGEEKRVYCRKELENLRFIGMEEQRKMWIEVYCGLGDTLRKEYDGLVASTTEKHTRPSRRHPVISGNDHSEHLYDQEANWYEGENNVYDEENDYSDDDDDDDDYSSIQRPAFKVTGEPNFDSGPPEDGFEYLRRVKWEALRLPKVKIATVQESKLKKEQTFYMPQIPDIASCLEHLLPLKEWEEAFLADFSELRRGLSHLEATPSQLQDKFDGLISGEKESCLSDAGLGAPRPKSSTANSPTLSVILQMDAVARVSMLRKRITAVQTMSTLSRDDCLWLFALCVAVDTPLDADTCAALRSLLRKCASLRADKSELDDEVIMLNMLITISGRYFGQSEQ